MTRQDVSLFGTETISDYLVLCEKSVIEFDQEPNNTLRCFSTILFLTHISDWLQYKLNDQQFHMLGLTGRKDSIKVFFEDKNKDLKIIREIANGFKHLHIEHKTQSACGYGQGLYGTGLFGVSTPCLVIDKGEEYEASVRWEPVRLLCKRTLVYWGEVLKPITEETK